MQNRYDCQPFQVVRQINNFSPMARNSGALKDRNDFNNLPVNSKAHDKLGVDKHEKLSFVERDTSMESNRNSYLNAPIRKIWESDWTLLIPETHKENGNIF